MCEHWMATRSCATTLGVRMFQPGPRCPNHTPAALAGRQDVIPDPDWGAAAGYAKSGWKGHSTGETKIDERHRRSGQRASGALRRASHADD
jgi:hypothetical protein